MSALGFLLPAAAIGLGSVTVKPVRSFDPAGYPSIVAQATIEELHHDDLEITDHPIQKGAVISDHAFKRPAEIMVRCAFSNSPTSNGAGSQLAGLAAASGGSAVRTIIGAATTVQSLLGGNSVNQIKDTYASFLKYQSLAVLFDVYSGKRIYKSMVIKSLSVTTDKENENSLLIVIVFRQIIIVNTTTVTVPINSSAQAMPEKTTPVANVGTQSLKATSGAITSVVTAPDVVVRSLL